MHYKDGTEAQLGDIARGKGYNHQYPVQGVVVGLNPGAGSCDIHLLIPRKGFASGTQALPFVPTLIEEHGTCGDFELVHR